MLYLGAIKEEIPSKKLKNICLGITSYLINKVLLAQVQMLEKI